MATYARADAEALRIVKDQMEKYHSELLDAEVTIDVLFAHASVDENGDQKGVALKHHGYRAAAVVRIVSLKDRTKGMADAEIVIDGDEWPTIPDDQRDALIDHELTHLELKLDDETGLVVRDDLGRPKLKMRLHDWQFGFFDAVVRRHGLASPESLQINNFLDDPARKQLYLFGGEDGEKPKRGRSSKQRELEPAGA